LNSPKNDNPSKELNGIKKTPKKKSKAITFSSLNLLLKEEVFKAILGFS